MNVSHNNHTQHSKRKGFRRDYEKLLNSGWKIDSSSHGKDTVLKKNGHIVKVHLTSATTVNNAGDQFTFTQYA